MFNNVCVELDVMFLVGCNVDGKFFIFIECGEYDMGFGKWDSFMSDGDGSVYEDDLESFKCCYVVSMSWGSV